MAPRKRSQRDPAPPSLEARPIRVRGAREHNLQDVDLELPRNALIAVVGVSGSGKSSLVFDTLFLEGQRRYVEALAATARRGTAPLARPDVDLVEGLPPSVAVDQRSGKGSPRETLGTLTEVHHLLRVLFARLGTVHCPSCGRELAQLTPQQMLDRLLAEEDGTRVQLGAPLAGRDLPPEERLALARAEGFVRMRVDGVVTDIDDVGDPSPEMKLEVIVDRLVVRDRDRLRPRLADSLETALAAGNGHAFALVGKSGEDADERWFSERLSCASCELDLPRLSTATFSPTSPHGACSDCEGLGRSKAGGVCKGCGGSRLGELARSVRLGGESLPALLALTPQQLEERLQMLRQSTAMAHEVIVEPICDEVESRARLLMRVGLPYLTFDRGADTLATGEISRALLANHCGSQLAGVLYCLDEPTAGLHAADANELIEVLVSLRDAGNTMLVCEHDRRFLARADHVVEIGPGAGREGGQLVFSGTVADLERADTATGRALRGELSYERERRKPTGALKLRGARARNLRSLDVDVPLGQLVALCGRSGSGKSTLLGEVLEPALRYRLAKRSGKKPAKVELELDSVAGDEGVTHLERVDASTTHGARGGDRSVPATLLGVLNPLRELFAATKVAKMRGWGRDRFSFNTGSGRCGACSGRGHLRVELELLPAVEMPCEVCGGARFERETLEARFRGLSIAQVLDLTIEEAAELFVRIPRIEPLLATARDTGLGYLRLGQPLPTLSGGERQRLRIASTLGKPRLLLGTVFLLDEPTLGLHAADVATLLALFDRLLDAGASILCIEHNLDLLRTADHLIELGPEGGPGGGQLIAQGSPEALRQNKTSPTGTYLASGS